ncbi:MAG TPA: hypothetical protein VN084_03780 [Methylophilaceae bacterium]|nr:hypothetical protein [Methylophilaceae bacterium]
MKKVPHLLVCISGHGFGHLAQVAPVLNALHDLSPDIRLTIRSTIPQPLLRQRIRPEFNHLQEATDFGMVMRSALQVNVAASMQAYVDFHADWPAKVAAEAQRLQRLAPDLLLTDVAYLPLAAADRIGLPAVAMCSLNWADIFAHYCHAMPEADRIQQEIASAYACASCFLQPTPSMPMPWLPERMVIGPLAEAGRQRRFEIERQLGLQSEDRLVLVSMGGIPTRVALDRWPRLPGVKWLVQGDWSLPQARDDMHAFESLGMPFSDLLASCDLLLTKPGYGAFVEAAVSGVPVLFVRRDDWPEQPYLVDWLAQVRHCQGIDPLQLERGGFVDALEALLEKTKPLPLAATGHLQAARYMLSRLAEAI